MIVGRRAKKTKWKATRVDRKVARTNAKCVKGGRKVIALDTMLKKKNQTWHLLITRYVSFSLHGNHVKLVLPFHSGGNWDNLHKITQLVSDKSSRNTKHTLPTRHTLSHFLFEESGVHLLRNLCLKARNHSTSLLVKRRWGFQWARQPPSWYQPGLLKYSA